MFRDRVLLWFWRYCAVPQVWCDRWFPVIRRNPDMYLAYQARQCLTDREARDFSWFLGGLL